MFNLLQQHHLRVLHHLQRLPRRKWRDKNVEKKMIYLSIFFRSTFLFFQCIIFLIFIELILIQSTTIFILQSYRTLINIAYRSSLSSATNTSIRYESVSDNGDSTKTNIHFTRTSSSNILPSNTSALNIGNPANFFNSSGSVTLFALKDLCMKYFEHFSSRQTVN